MLKSETMRFTTMMPSTRAVTVCLLAAMCACPNPALPGDDVSGSEPPTKTGRVLALLTEDRLEEALHTLGEAVDLSNEGDHLAAAAAGVHRELMQRTDDERFELLYAWSMPTAERKSVRILTTPVPRDAPPSAFARVLGERPRTESFAISSIGGVRGIFSTGWTLVQAADGAGRLSRLAAELEPLSAQQVRNADVLLLLTQLAARRVDASELAEQLKQRTVAVNQPATAETSAPLDESNILLAAAALQREELRAASVDLLEALVESTYGSSNRWRALLRIAHAVAVQGHRGESDPEVLYRNRLKYWAPTTGRTAAQHAAGAADAMWLVHDDHVLHLAGASNDVLFCRFPLTGDFYFSCEAQEGGRIGADGGLVFGGLQFEPLGSDWQLSVWDADGAHRVQKSCPFVRHDDERPSFNRLSIRSTADAATFAVNLHPMWFDNEAALASPWLGLRSFGQQRPVFRNLKISGTPVVPRKVSLAQGNQLRGWQSQFFDQPQPPSTSPAVKSDEYQASGGSDSHWRVADGVIHGAKREAATANPQSRLYYQRPLLNGETVAFEFFHEPGLVEVHPALGRLAFLIEPNGVRMHWITDGEDEWTGLPADNGVLEPLNRRGPQSLPLRGKQWNAVKLSRAGGRVTLSLNERVIYERNIDYGGDHTFGFYRDRTKTAAKIRNIVMTGDWPDTLPADFFENPAAVANEEPDKVGQAVNEVISDEWIAANVRPIRRQAAQLSAAERYEFLADWVLPTDNHETFRTAFDFTPTHPAFVNADRPVAAFDRTQVSPASDRTLASAATPVQSGGELISPALELVRLAQDLSKLDALRWRIQKASAKRNDQQRAQACLLALVDIERGDFAAANRDLDSLEAHLREASERGFTAVWPETLVIAAGIRHPEIREASRDLAVYILDELRAERAKGTSAWERYVGAAAEQLKRLEATAADASIAQTSDVHVGLENWTPVSSTSARSRGEGWPNAGWEWSPGQLLKHAGHHEDYMFLRMPLRGDFEIEGEFGGFGWRDTQVMVAGTWLAPLVDHESYVTGNFRAELPKVGVEPRLPETGEWIRLRTVVKGEVATTFLNGRRIHEVSLAAERDPWVAIRSPYFGFGGARDVRITGTPEIPSQVHISKLADLGGWTAYFDESVGGEEGDWRHDREAEGGGFVGRRRMDLPGSGLESLLRYQRPMLENGSIEYDFYYSAGGSHVHPALDRRVLMLDPSGVRIHWVTDGAYDRTGQDPFNLSDEPANRRGPKPLPLKPDAWNTLRLDLKGDAVQLSLNEQLVYECELEPTNQRTFGLFHYSDQTEARVGNIVWNGDWPRQLPPVAQQQLADHLVERLDERLPELKAVFQHDFVRDGLPLWRFHFYDEGWEEHIEARPGGLYMERPCKNNYTRFVISPRMRLHGDFDAITEFKDLKIESTPNGKWGISLRSCLEDKDTTIGCVFRGLMRRTGQLDQHIAISEFAQWKPDGTHRAWYPGKVSEESTFGKMRLARRGDQLHCLISEGDSPNFRRLYTETVPTDSGRYDGIRLRVGAYSDDDEPSMASVVWKNLIVRAEDITNLPDPPPPENTAESSEEGAAARDEGQSQQGKQSNHRGQT